MEKTNERKNRKMLWQLAAAALVVIFVLVAMFLPRRAKTKPPEEPPAPVTVTVILSGAENGPLAGGRMREAACRDAFMQTVPLGWISYSHFGTADPAIRAMPLLLSELDRMLGEYAKGHTAYSVPTVSAGYTAWEEQTSPGDDPAGGGYTIVLSLSVPTGDTMTSVPMSNPLAATLSAWLSTYAAAYGFLYTGDGTLRYYGSPHAAYLHAKSCSLSDYIACVAKTTAEHPLVMDLSGICYRVFWVAAGSDGSASLTLPVDTVYTVSGTNAGGFIVAVRD